MPDSDLLVMRLVQRHCTSARIYVYNVTLAGMGGRVSFATRVGDHLWGGRRLAQTVVAKEACNVHYASI